MLETKIKRESVFMCEAKRKQFDENRTDASSKEEAVIIPSEMSPFLCSTSGLTCWKISSVVT